MNEVLSNLKGKRLADELIYLKEQRYDEPKEIFKFIGQKIKLRISSIGNDVRLLDVGCATGELIYYFKTLFKNVHFAGLDVSPKLIEAARNKVPDVEFYCKSIFDSSFFAEKKWHFVICCGVLSIFDDIKPALKNLLSCTLPKGSVYIAGAFNEDPVDVIMRYRLATEINSEWQTGWNIFSTETYERILKDFDLDIDWEWYDFKMPFAIPKRSDPMRTWTIRTESNPYQLVNGASQLINMKLLEIHIRK
jgi:SAM-dependent methyltransferase